MRAEIVAVGEELLAGHVVDTNSAWLGQRLAAAGVPVVRRTTVGDTVADIAGALRDATARSEVVVVSGGLGPTPDDVTREALAEVTGSGLERDEAVLERITAMFAARRRPMPASNARQADVPRGATVIPQAGGTAPGLVCEVGGAAVYALPGVPWELQEMVERAVVPDVARRASGRPRGDTVVVSRLVRTWGLAEAEVAERLASRVAAAEAGAGGAGSGPGRTTFGFLAAGVEGIGVRITITAAPAAEAARQLDAEEAEVRAVLGDSVFGVDAVGMEEAVGHLLAGADLTLGLAESMTGGLVASRLVAVPGASRWFRGSVVSYASEVKRALLGVGPGPVVSEEAAARMAEGASRVLGADAGVAVTGVAGPEPQDGRAPGTVFIGVHLDGETSVVERGFVGDREHLRGVAAISCLDQLRRRLLARGGRA